MPEFILNDKYEPEFTALPMIAQGYIEAMFFTSCEGSIHDGSFDPENGSPLPDEASWLEIEPDTLADIVATCVKWRDDNAADLALAYEARRDYDEVRAGNDLWYTSNRHGVGFWDRGFPDDLGERLTNAAHTLGERYPGWEMIDEEEGRGIVYVD